MNSTTFAVVLAAAEDDARVAAQGRSAARLLDLYGPEAVAMYVAHYLTAVRRIHSEMSGLVVDIELARKASLAR